MRKFIIKLAAFAVILVALDTAAGFVFRYLQAHAKGGDFGRNEYIFNKLTDDIVLFGSSRCMHHYDPDIIADSTTLSCYNCGRDGNGIVMFWPCYRMMTARYTPKVVVYDVHLGFDLQEGDNAKYLPWIRMYYGRPEVDSVFWDVNQAERIKMLSNAYRYNSRFIQLISDNIRPLQSDVRGYRPVDRTMEYEPEKDITEKPKEYKYDPLKLRYMENLMADCKARGIQLVMTISPSYGATDDRIFRPLTALCKKYGIPLLNHYCDSNFVFNRDYFYDSIHMNRKGATAYSARIAGQLHQIVSQE